MLDDGGRTAVMIRRAARGVSVGGGGRERDHEVDQSLAAAIEAAITAGACHEAQRIAPGLYAYVGEAHRRTSRRFLNEFVGRHAGTAALEDLL